jgi:predicted ArsR family transcriptional regulator
MTTIEKKPNEQKVIDALGGAEIATVDEVAGAAGIGRTSARKYLAGLEQTGKVKRAAGGREGKRKLPDRYSLVASRGRRQAAPSEDSGERLRPGGLDELVLGYMREHREEGPFGPTTVAKGLGRSSGAVGNCLARLGAAGKLSQVSQRPRRYALQETR